MCSCIEYSDHRLSNVEHWFGCIVSPGNVKRVKPKIVVDPLGFVLYFIVCLLTVICSLQK